MNSAAVLSERDALGMRTLTFDQPARANCVSAALVEELLSMLDTIRDDGTRVLVLKANGKNFCGGFDLSDCASQSEGDLLLRFVRLESLLQAIRHAPCITIACVQGAAYGAGADIVAACSVRIGTPDSRFRFPGFQFGIALGTAHLMRLIGADCARRILLKNQVIQSPEAHAIGLLTHVVASDAFSEAITSILEGTERLDGAAMATLLAGTRVDTRDRDMAELVRSASHPGLLERIAAYRAASPPERR